MWLKSFLFHLECKCQIPNWVAGRILMVQKRINRITFVKPEFFDHFLYPCNPSHQSCTYTYSWELSFAETFWKFSKAGVGFFQLDSVYELGHPKNKYKLRFLGLSIFQNMMILEDFMWNPSFSFWIDDHPDRHWLISTKNPVIPDKAVLFAMCKEIFEWVLLDSLTV